MTAVEMFERYWSPRLMPVLAKEGYCSGKPHGIKGRVPYKVTVWSHPIESDRYCYGVSLAGGIMAGSGTPGADTYFGCYSCPENALAAGLREVQP